jgi:phosphatidyl-myo-inositol dimannoside synthase
MKLGMVAREFPPGVGGMPTLAAGLARSLATEHELVVMVRNVTHAYDESFPVHPVLTGLIDDDLEHLADVNVDAWLLMNSGYAPIIPQLKAPCFVYCHGNDFLKPFVMRRAYRNLAPRFERNPLTWPFVSVARRVIVRRDVRRGLRHIRAAFANSRATAQRLIAAHGVPADIVHVVNPGVDDDFFQDRAQRGDDQFQLLTVSRLNRGNLRKNVDSTLRAVAQLADIPVRLIVVGDGDDRPRLVALAHELRVESKVDFVGEVDRPTLLKLYRKSDLFILVPRQSRLDIEGFGIVYVEAAASGLPVLGTSRRGATDAIEDGVNGYLLPSADAKTIASGIRRVWETQNALSTDDMRRFAERFRWPQVARRVSALIHQYVPNPASQPIAETRR